MWRSKVRIIPAGSEDWGPSEAEIQQAGVFEFTAQVEPSEDFIDTEAMSSEEEQQLSDGDLCEQLEAMAFAEEYCDSGFEAAVEYVQHSSGDHRADGPLRKCARLD